MENKLHYYNWFQKVMSVFIDVFFYASSIASLYVLTSFLSGVIRYTTFAVVLIVYLCAIHFCKGMISDGISYLFDRFKQLDTKTMFIIITLLMIVVKCIFTFFFNYDGTQSGDIEIYNDIADQIIATGNIHSDAIAHLYGLALHFVLFKLIGIPIHIGLFVVFYIGTIVNFFSFVKITGKEKAFFIVLIYQLMFSSALISFCPTHELFVYMYVSIFLYFYNKLIYESDKKRMIIWLLASSLNCVLTCFVNPGGYIIYIIMLLTMFLTNVRLDKKIVIIISLLLSILCSNMISKYLNVNEYSTAINTYTILIHGTNPESLGEQVDGYPLKQMRYYIYDHNMDFSEDAFREAAQNVFISQLKYLFTHPVVLIRLIIHKIYILWSGVHYPIELARFYDAVDGVVYYVFLGINTLIYLFMLTIRNVYKRNKTEDEIAISNYKLELLGVIALTLICIVANKYSLYVTLFIYLTSIYETRFGEE